MNKNKKNRFWAARDRDGDLSLYLSEPAWEESSGTWGMTEFSGAQDPYEASIGYWCSLDPDLFPDIEKGEVMEVEILRRGLFDAIYDDLRVAEKLLGA